MAGTTSQNEIKIKVEGAQGAISDLSKVDAYLKKVDASIRRVSQSANACRLDTPLTALNKLGDEANASSQHMQTLTGLMPRVSDLYRFGQERSTEQAEPLQMYMGLTQRDAEKWQAQLKGSREGPDGALRGLIAYYSEATDWAAGFASLTKKSMTDVENAFVQMAYTGKLSFAGMVDSIIADLIRLSVRANITGPLAGALSVWTSKMFEVSPVSAMTDATAFNYDWFASVLHSGGMANESSLYRAMPTSIFEAAPRFHNGRLPWNSATELPAVIRRDESVLTPGQMRTLAGSGKAFESQINIQVINQTGTGAVAEASQQRNAQGGVDAVVLLKREVASDIAKGGVIDQTIRGRYGVSPVVRGR